VREVQNHSWFGTYVCLPAAPADEKEKFYLQEY